MKKGFTLIELLVSLSILGLILGAEVYMCHFTLKNNSLKIERNREKFYITEALIYIDYKINEGYKSVSVVDNEIRLIKADTDKVDKIEFINTSSMAGNLVVFYYPDLKSKKGTRNYIVKNIAEFNAEVKENVVFVSIKGLSGEKYERCFSLKNLK